MNTGNYRVLYLIDKIKINHQGKCPLRCRITYLKERKIFSTGLFVKPKDWDNKQQKAKSITAESKFINTEISLIKNKLNQAFLFLQVQGNNFDVEDIFKKYKGENTQKQIGVVEFYSEYMDRLKKMIGKDFKESTWGKFNEILPALKDYICFQYKKRDIKLVDDTLWKGTLSEIGVEGIRNNMLSNEGEDFISFMKFIKTLVDELGIFIAICSRNNLELVESAIEKAGDKGICIFFNIKHKKQKVKFLLFFIF